MKKSVLIVGGGVSGLAAAGALARRHVPVTVLEAKERLGGRIHSLHNGTFPIELGAEFIHGESKALLDTIQQAALPIQTVAPKNRKFENGRFVADNIWEQAEELFNRINPDDPDVSFEEFLGRQRDIDERARNSARHFVEGFNAADSKRISAHALLRAERAADQMNGAAQFRINRGYGALVEFLAHEVERFGGVCVTNAWAREIRWKSNAVEISADANGQRKLFRAEATVITVPLGILKSGEFRFLPALPEKADAMRNLEFGNVVKLILQFKSSFWEDCGFIHTLDKPIPTWWNDPRGPILTGWAGGPQADVLLKQTQPQLEAAGLEILGQTFSARKELLRDQLVASHYWNWQADPHIRGAYSYIPVKGIHLPQILAAPIAETLFFAGEATVADAQTGTVFGALESGLRAAREVLGSG